MDQENNILLTNLYIRKLKKNSKMNQNSSYM